MLLGRIDWRLSWQQGAGFALWAQQGLEQAVGVATGVAVEQDSENARGWTARTTAIAKRMRLSPARRAFTGFINLRGEGAYRPRTRSGVVRLSSSQYIATCNTISLKSDGSVGFCMKEFAPSL
jgi:hypothetical protein